MCVLKVMVKELGMTGGKSHVGLGFEVLEGIGGTCSVEVGRKDRRDWRT